MNNAEKFSEEIFALNYNIAMVNGKLKHCDETKCKQCQFNKEPNTIDCKQATVKWLLEEFKEPILSDEAKAYLISIINPFSVNDVRSITKYHDSRTKKYNIEIKMIYAVFCFYFEEYSNLDNLFSNLTIGHLYGPEDLGLN